MPFLVENGTGVSGANSFASVAAFKDYHDLRGNSYTGKTDTQIEQSLVNGTDYLERAYRYKGERHYIGQSLSFPRLGVYREDSVPVDGVPVEIFNACCELAYRHLTGVKLFATPSVTNTTGYPTSVKEDQVGPLRRRVEFAIQSGAQSPTTLVTFTDIDLMLRLFILSGSVVELRRA